MTTREIRDGIKNRLEHGEGAREELQRPRNPAPTAVVTLEVELQVERMLNLPACLYGTVSIEAEMQHTTEGWVPRALTVESVDLTAAYLVIDSQTGGDPEEYRLDAPELSLLLRQRVGIGQVDLSPWPFRHSTTRLGLLQWKVLCCPAVVGIEERLVEEFDQQCRSRREYDETWRMEERRSAAV